MALTSSAAMDDTSPSSRVAVVSWPSAPLTESLVRKSIDTLRSPPSVVSLVPQSFSKLLQWSTYDNLDHELTLSRSECVLSSSYTIRKALIRKHYLSHCVHSYLAKHKGSILEVGVPRTWEIEISFADELDELWADDLWELGNELDDIQSWWILKPGMADRGMGIRLFKSKNTLQKIFEEFDGEFEEEEGDETAVMTSQLRHFVAQEYVPTPLLFDPLQVPLDESSPPDLLQGRKFHIRAYCFASGALSLYLYPRALALFSAVPYTPPAVKDDDQANYSANIDLIPHLTNSSLQAQLGDQNVRLLEELVGCDILAGASGKHNKDSKFTADHLASVVSQMADILAETFKAALENPVHFQPLPNAFELFGVDFLISHSPSIGDLYSTSALQVKLLEINAEPAIEFTGPRLSWILEDLFVAMGKICIEPFLSVGVNGESLAAWPVGEMRHGIRKCLEIEVRGSSGRR